jgi:acetyl esterase/lipase
MCRGALGLRGPPAEIKLMGYLSTGLARAKYRLAAACDEMAFAIGNLPARFTSVRVTRDLPYGDQPGQVLDVYAQPGLRDRPIVVFWYGGGWTDGHKEEYRFIGTALAERGYVAVLPDYRKYPAVQFPSFVHDGARALVWARLHAHEWGGDPSRIVVMGHSVGAHLAAMLAYQPEYLRAAGGSRRWIRGFVGLSGIYAPVPETEIFRQIIPPPYRSNDWQPLWHVNSEAPPSLLLHGLEDRLVNPQETVRLRNALVRHGVDVEMELYSGRSHADTVAAFSPMARRRAPALNSAARFIDRLRPRRTARSSPLPLTTPNLDCSA